MYFTLFLCMAIANVAFQAFNEHDWDVAVERTYFQGAAVLVVWLVKEVSHAAS